MKVNKALRRAFGDSLAQSRKTEKLSLAELAMRSGVERLKLNSFEAGTEAPILDELYAIAAALAMHPAELIPVRVEDDEPGIRGRTDEDDALYPVGDGGDEDEDDEEDE